MQTLTAVVCRSPDITNTLFRSGYIEAWGHGTLKMIKECEAAGLPKPVYFYDMSGLFVEFKKDIYNEEYLMELGLNERQVKAVMYVKEKGEITNKEYLEIISISKRTATTAMTLTSCIGD